MKKEDVKEGMRVRITENDKRTNGVTATVEDRNSENLWWCFMDDCKERHLFFAYELEPADQPTQYNVGDEVELIKFNWACGDSLSLRDIGVIVRQNLVNPRIWYVDFPAQTGVCLDEDYLRLVTPAEQAKDPFERVFGISGETTQNTFSHTFDLRGVNRPTLCHVCHEIHDSREQVEDCFNRAYSKPVLVTASKLLDEFTGQWFGPRHGAEKDGERECEG